MVKAHGTGNHIKAARRERKVFTVARNKTYSVYVFFVAVSIIFSDKSTPV
jgi:hypothetical protein